MNNNDEIPVGKAKDLRNNKFDKLTVLYRVNSPNNCTRWKCKCDCGNITYAYSNNLLNDKFFHSCGCETKRGLAKTPLKGHIKNLLHKTFGQLTVIELMPERAANRQTLWKCQCSCGNITIVRGSDLVQGHTTSCGCLKSKGEYKINQLLQEHNINFCSQKTFSTCYNPFNQALFKFDFFVNNSYLIEYDGDIHFNDTKTRGWYSTEYQNQIQQFDQLKNEWCKNNNIPLIRIPYTHLKDLCIEDLLLETSQFIVNKNEEERVNAC